MITTNTEHGPGKWVLEPSVKRKSILRFVNEELAAPADNEAPLKKCRAANRNEDREPEETPRHNPSTA